MPTVPKLPAAHESEWSLASDPLAAASRPLAAHDVFVGDVAVEFGSVSRG